MKNWKTTIAGLLSSIGAGMQLSDNGTVKLIGGVLISVGLLLLGVSSKDHNVTGK